ncbi:DUF805 domain-containing protein [Anaerovibrio lipolyticus]|uniref:DUF805 domain-containing protein n=1 Tax=Anaerovibrio lipolyticus TaxID=82374 RepID=UPI000486302C|nr:DUF805 domain-containing protein [Anaerovibrio lipolyticus]
MYCSKCGKPISDDSTFCMYCGTKLDNNLIDKELVKKDTHTTSDNSINEKPFNTKDKNYYSGVFITRLSTLWSGRINRKDYIIGNILFFIAFFPCFFIDNDLIIQIFGLILFIAWEIFSIRRFHDVDKAGFYIIFLCTPIVGLFFFIYLIFKKGTSGENQYGPEPS